MAGGAPKGNKNAVKGKFWTHALQNVAIGDAERLHRIALAVFDAAEKGDMAAVKEIGDRLDGKPHQTASIESEQTVRHIISDEPMTADEWKRQYADRMAPAAGTTKSTH